MSRKALPLTCLLASLFLVSSCEKRPPYHLVEENLHLLAPERSPKTHVPAPVLRPDSKVEITLRRSACYGNCPEYTVSLSTNGIVFNGGRYVAAKGKHTDKVNADKVRSLARRFIEADFYSMESSYTAAITDNPTYTLSISIDGQTKAVQDHMGALVGMPAIISELEVAVDTLARTQRWIKGR